MWHLDMSNSVFPGSDGSTAVVDRPPSFCTGMGWSEPGSQPRTSQQIVKELHTLLGNAGVQGSYVLVGHSFGGINMQLYASRYPDEAAGMVLVDSAIAGLDFLRSMEPSFPSPVLTKTYATIGVTRLR
jgi:pimeloyl-ACP methyl ester carboxylesterase